MSHSTSPTEAAVDYAAAYAAHYSQRDLPLALRLYQELMAFHAGAREVGYSRAQIRNIVDVVVPEADLLHAQIGLALARLAPAEPV